MGKGVSHLTEDFMRSSAILIAVFSLIATASLAAEPLKFSPNNRLMVMGDDGRDGSSNVELQEKTYDELPTYIRKQMDIVAGNCTDSAQNAKSIKVYSYVSDYNRRKKLPPNYILDMMPLKQAKAKLCSTPAVCRAGRCNLWGYSATGTETWVRTFVHSVSEWTVKKQPIPKFPRKSLSIISANISTDHCDKVGGVEVEGGCVVDYVWRAQGLSVLRTTTLPPVENEESATQGGKNKK